RLCHCFRVRPGKGGLHRNGGRHHVGIFFDRQGAHRHQADHDDNSRKRSGKNRTFDEKIGEVHWSPLACVLLFAAESAASLLSDCPDCSLACCFGCAEISCALPLNSCGLICMPASMAPGSLTMTRSPVSRPSLMMTQGPASAPSVTLVACVTLSWSRVKTR